MPIVISHENVAAHKRLPPSPYIARAIGRALERVENGSLEFIREETVKHNNQPIANMIFFKDGAETRIVVRSRITPKVDAAFIPTLSWAGKNMLHFGYTADKLPVQWHYPKEITVYSVVVVEANGHLRLSRASNFAGRTRISADQRSEGIFKDDNRWMHPAAIPTKDVLVGLHLAGYTVQMQTQNPMQTNYLMGIARLFKSFEANQHS